MIASIPDSDEGEAEEEAEGAAHLKGDNGEAFGHLFWHDLGILTIF